MIAKKIEEIFEYCSTGLYVCNKLTTPAITKVILQILDREYCCT